MSSSYKKVERTIDWCYPEGPETHEWLLKTNNNSDRATLYHNGEIAFSCAVDFLPELVRLLTTAPEDDARVQYADYAVADAYDKAETARNLEYWNNKQELEKLRKA